MFFQEEPEVLEKAAMPDRRVPYCPCSQLGSFQEISGELPGQQKESGFSKTKSLEVFFFFLEVSQSSH